MLFLDEPTTYLDVGHQRDLMALIRELQHTLRMTVILVLHDINQALMVSDRVWLLKQGRLIADRPAKNCFDTGLLQQVFGLGIQIVEVPQYGPYIIQVP